MTDEHAHEARSEDSTITFRVADLNLADKTNDDLIAARSEMAEGDAMLVVKRGSNVGATYLLDTDVSRAGRHPDNEVFLDDVTVSRRHAEFIKEADGFVIADVGSLNGTYLNGDRIERAQLKQGDEVQIGKFKFVFLPGLSGS